jgi:excisionase family DNA binding protein
MEAGSVGATLVSFGWVTAKPEDGMNLYPIPKNVSPDAARHESSDFPNRLLSVEEAARLLGLSASTLNKLRLTGGGPRFAKLGRRCLYDGDDLKKWAAERKRMSTSER